MTLFGRGMRQAQRPDFMACGVVLVAQLLGDAEANVTVLVQEAEEIFALDEVNLAGINRFRPEFVRLARNCSA